MPREPRKSSLGTRRGPPRQHIPFRADDLGHGKKTGIAVQYVDRNSDEFEPFAEVMKQADNRTPPRIKSKKKRIVVDGEMSMDLAESNQGSPLAYFTNASHLYQSTNTRRPSSLRPLPRSSIVDYDQLPSPRHHPDTPSARKSLTNGARPSPLTKSYAAPDPEPDMEPPDSQNYADAPETQVDDGPGYGHISDESEEAAEVAEEVTPSPRRSNKGKQRATPDEVQDHHGDGVEDDIARGLEGVENDPDEVEAEVPQKKRAREEGQKSQRPRGRPAKRVAIAPPERSATPEGVRRGRRHRYKPLEWWRQEKVVYGRRESGLTLVPQIKEIIRIPKEPSKPLGKAGKRGRAGSVRAKTRELRTPVPHNPEEGWDEKTSADGVVLDFLTREPVKRRVIQTARMFEPRSAANSNWFFQKIFGEGDFIAAGEMRIPPRGEKPSKSSKDNAYVFYVVEGAVSVAIHESTYIVSSGGMFLVPRGNTYCIHNICQRDVKLFFTQARHVGEEEIASERASQSVPPTSHRRRHSEVAEDGPRTSTGPKRAKSRL
ncbi:Mif2/CENP-C like-domain-containing protein [Pisolithus marmoratus]|nr:Mif2/CENP-C like-domain-containing protein [Pisolithus marmoratus]